MCSEHLQMKKKSGAQVLNDTSAYEKRGPFFGRPHLSAAADA